MRRTINEITNLAIFLGRPRVERESTRLFKNHVQGIQNGDNLFHLSWMLCKTNLICPFVDLHAFTFSSLAIARILRKVARVRSS